MTPEETIRAAAIAHAIRLGKCPAPGMVISGTFQVKQIKEADFAAGKLDRAQPKSEAVKLEFEVTREDIDNCGACHEFHRDVLLEEEEQAK